MPFTLIKGTFHVTDYSPDGDSVKFNANSNSNWKKLKGKTVKPNTKSHVQLRVEGTDSLETHFGGPNTHQPLVLAHQAGDELMTFLGITEVIWGPSHGRVTSAKDGTKGYILSRSTGPYGRPICFLFAGSSPNADGSDVWMKPALLKKSLNHHMLSIGHAYPLFYETLFFDLRGELTRVTRKTRSSKKDVWKSDKSQTWFDGTDITALKRTVPIFPKLFRRLVDHKKSGQSMAKLPDRLATEKITILPTVQHTHFDTVVAINGRKVRMTENPEDLVFGTVIR